ncbi:MAG: glycosyltransferase family 1 protein [Opitutaceae bacterium]|nr:glycosyltransferase family 1 protein [Opitutaceae bacterium]
MIVDTLHRDLPDVLTKEEIDWRETAIGHAIQSACKFLCISEFVRARFIQHYRVPMGSTEVSTPPLRVQPGNLEGTHSRKLERPFFFYPANAWAHKNHLTLLRAYGLYRELLGSAGWDLVFTGYVKEGPFANELKKKVQEINGTMERRVHLMGHLADAEFVALFSSAGALVFPSLYEGYGMPVVEAMQLGVPVLCGDVAALPEVADKAALFFNPHSASSIASAMTSISNDRALQQRLRQAGKDRVGRLSTADEKERFLNFIRSIHT